MAITPKKLAERSAAVALPIAGDVLNLTYRVVAVADFVGPEAQAWADATIGITDVAAAQTALAEKVCAFVATWDMQDDDGAPYPLDTEHVAALDSAFLGAVLTAVLGDYGQGKASAPASSVPSGATSSPTANSTSSQAA